MDSGRRHTLLPSILRRVTGMSGFEVVTVHGPVASGKSQLVAGWVQQFRDEGHIVTRVDLGDVTDLEPIESAPYVALDGFDPRRQRDQQVVREMAARWRSGALLGLLLASRSAQVQEVLRDVPGTATRVRPADLVLSRQDIIDDLAALGMEVSPAQATSIRSLSDGWAGLLLMAYDVISEGTMAAADEVSGAFDAAVWTRFGGEIEATHRDVIMASSAWPMTGEGVAGVIDVADLELAGWVARESVSSSIAHVVEPIARGLRAHAAVVDSSTGSRQRIAQVRQRVLAELIRQRRLPDAAELALLDDRAASYAAVVHPAIADMNLGLARRIARAAAQHSSEWFGGETSLLLHATVLGGEEMHRAASFDALRDVALRTVRTSMVSRASPSDSPAEHILRSGLRSAVLRQSGQPSAAATQASVVQSSWSVQRTTGSADGAGFVALTQSALSFLTDSHFSAAEDVADEAARIARRRGSPEAISLAASIQAAAAAVRGDIYAARRAVAEAQAQATGGWADLIDGLSGVAQALISIEEADFPSAGAVIEAVRAHEGSEFWWLYESVAAIVATITQGPVAGSNISQAISEKEGRGHVVTGPYLRTAMDAQRALLAQQPGLAVRVAAVHPDSEFSVVLEAIGELTMGRAERATRLAGSVSQSQSHRVRTGAAVVAAVVATYLNQPMKGVDRLRTAMDIMRVTGLRSPLRFIDVEARELLFALPLEKQESDELREWTAAPIQIDPPITRLAALTEREVQILRGFRDGHTSDQIAEQLGVSRNTVKTLTTRLYRKLGVSDRIVAVELALGAHLLD